MTAEAVPWDRGGEESGGNPFTDTIRAVMRPFPRERTGPKELEIIARYLGIALAHEVAYGRMDEDQVQQKFDEFKSSGIPVDKTKGSYEYYRSMGITVDWFNIDFQMKTLERYLPELLGKPKIEDNLTP
ncbi:hypothetical protein A2W45_03970 [Candidatus Curtissbacteria bacterium RIFCSPHIGHO2_12_41_11]|uniref:Uncharacterized protein n=2 Tax=Candidatus Curtissiibacteriota TaxID=1752717 RepID=A0A1F5H9N1_9BACT|nr:MAG: hypothetical protein A3D07_02245 [Candidatus Curtissbacteria bacterium RIFCSPHIGHO2_02_FULL_42_15]OGE00755.1 MAG: hypothetical protein A2W45_03970 [Candidatus Curtissbacteria bacterium RIFCSPHIGHO2_12_41_11]